MEEKKRAVWRERWEHFVKSLIGAITAALVTLTTWVVKRLFGL
jgi:hypothetical protein